MSENSEFEAPASSSTQVCDRLTSPRLQPAGLVDLQSIQPLPGVIPGSGVSSLVCESSPVCTVQDVQQLNWLLSDIKPPRRSESAPPFLAYIFQHYRSGSPSADDTQQGALGRSNLVGPQLRFRFAFSR